MSPPDWPARVEALRRAQRRLGTAPPAARRAALA